MSAEPMTMLEKAGAAAIAACPLAGMHPEVGEHIARAVLLAIREPDEATAAAMDDQDPIADLDDVCGIWRTGIDHILTESTGGRDGDR